MEKLRLEKHTAETVNVENYNHIDFSSMDRRQKQYSTANFRGADRLLSAIRNNDEKFEVIDNSIDDWDPFNEKKFAIFETTSKFHLKKNIYLVLDDISNDVSLHVRALSESNIVHCGSRHLTDVIWQPGSVVLG